MQMGQPGMMARVAGIGEPGSNERGPGRFDRGRSTGSDHGHCALPGLWLAQHIDHVMGVLVVLTRLPAVQDVEGAADAAQRRTRSAL
ncbi:hypothetical protein DF19_29305 [Streptomyces olindensis]|nr:hypothetical protein DF19_29305 [Streptomyces olindensis]